MDRAWYTFLDECTKGSFQSLSNEIIWPNFFSNFMHGLKSAILAIFQKSADWLDWPCPVSAALHFYSLDFFLFSIFIFKYETNVRKSASPFGIQIQIQSMWEVKVTKMHKTYKELLEVLGPIYNQIILPFLIPGCS